MKPYLASGLRPVMTLLVLLAVWATVSKTSGIQTFLLPTPKSVAIALWEQRGMLASSTATTLTETALGLLLGTILGAVSALAIVYSPFMQRWLMPLLLISQAIPVFALAPLLVLWFGFGMASKVVMAIIVIFFPITAAFSDGLRRTDLGFLDLARTMNASPLSILSHVRLPAFASGLRVATAIAPIGAVVGEWVGASSGLGYVMLNANARIETDVMFAALFVLALMAISLWVLVDRVLKRLLFWAPDTTAMA